MFRLDLSLPTRYLLRLAILMLDQMRVEKVTYITKFKILAEALR